jgi:hypothetical protein
MPTSINDGVNVQVRFVDAVFCVVDSSKGGKGNCCGEGGIVEDPSSVLSYVMTNVWL